MNGLSKILRDESPILLAGIGIAGFVAATVMAALATPKALLVLEVLDERAEEPSRMDQAKALAPVYAPTLGMLLISAACIVGANNVHQKRYLSMLALLSIGERRLNDWKAATLDEVGKTKTERIRNKSVAPDHDPDPQLIANSETKVLFYDYFSGRYFMFNSMNSIRTIVNQLNEDMLTEDFISLNDFYHCLHLPNMATGDEFGWHLEDGMIDVLYGSVLMGDTACITIDFSKMPKPRNKDRWSQ